MKDYDYLIVGAGLSGAVFAREMTDRGRKCLVIDKRDHIGGNCYSEKIEGIDCHKYGPHIFHTCKKEIWDYVNRFSEFNNYKHRVKVSHKDKIYSFPINLMTMYQLWGVKSPESALSVLKDVIKENNNPANFEEYVLSNVGEELYDIFYKGYTKKQWGKDPKDLPSDIAKRIPIRYTYNDDYYNDLYQGIPVEGYESLFKKLFDGIEVRLNSDYFINRDLWDNISGRIVYTGKIDEFYDYKYGSLEYRGIKFDTRIVPISDFQGSSIINYTDEDVFYTRIVEHKHFSFTTSNHTVITIESPRVPFMEDIPYYPINTKSNNSTYFNYKNIPKNRVIFLGRIAEFKYYDMDKAIENVLNIVKKEG